MVVMKLSSYLAYSTASLKKCVEAQKALLGSVNKDRKIDRNILVLQMLVFANT